MINNFTFHFQSDGKQFYNDVVMPGSPFRIREYDYSLLITPKTKFWRFGIRLSKTPVIKFFHPEFRYKSPEFFNEYIDIHLSVGEWHSNSWSLSNRLQVAQHNIPNASIILARIDDYSELNNVFWQFFVDQNTGKLVIKFGQPGPDEIITTSVSIPEEFTYFQFFAWADQTEFSLHLNGTVESILPSIHFENQIESFTVGNITFRKGYIFDSNVITNNNILILPASESGFASPNILNHALELVIPFPERNTAGHIELFKLHDSKEASLAGYGYYSETPALQFQVIKLFRLNIIRFDDIKGINLLLPEDGVQSQNIIESVQAYDNEFNAGPMPPVTISILSNSDFESIRETFLGKYTITEPNSNYKPREILLLENELETELSEPMFSVTNENQITRLFLINMMISEGTVLSTLSSSLISLSLINCQVLNINFFRNLSSLRSLFIDSSKISSFSFLKYLPNLKVLGIQSSDIPELNLKTDLDNIENLYITNIGLIDTSFLKNATRLKVLDLSKNNIRDLSSMEGPRHLRYLNVSKNHIIDINSFEWLEELQYLDMSHNRVANFDVIPTMPSLIYLKADDNDFLGRSGLILNESENHHDAITNALLREAEEDQREYILPAKILLMGNHESGKSSLLHYVLTNSFLVDISSTHIIKIEKFVQGNGNIPDAIFFDFGGQDYYHGIYRAFLSGGSAYLILWNNATNSNSSRKDKNDIYTQDFSLDYWINQKKYFEQEKFDDTNDPIFTIQTYADKSPRKPIRDTYNNIDYQFYVAITDQPMQSTIRQQKNRHALIYLKQCILDLIEEKKVLVNRPAWFINFIEFILSHSNDQSHSGYDISYVFPHYQRKVGRRLEYLRDDLDQLHKQGLILYYKDLLPDTLWLNPSALVEYIHKEILSKENIRVKGGRIPQSEFDNHDPSIINLLTHQKVIFAHQHGKNGLEYIIPSFLPLSTEIDSEFDLFTFGIGRPEFILKFKHFLPFGLINQLICFFGQLPNKKKFWRDQLLFAFQDVAKVLIHIDFQLLEIKVFCTLNKEIDSNVKPDVIKYLFFGILGQYWDLDIPTFEDFISFYKGTIKKGLYSPASSQFQKLENCEKLFEKEECRPTDLYISLDNKLFIYYPELCTTENELSIAALEIDENRNLSTKHKIISTYQFQSFTKQVLRKRKKVVISYSKRDLTLVNKFRQYLVPLFDDGLIENPWYCTLLVAGELWDEKIRKEFDEADIIFFMISENLMTTQYVKDNEIKNAIDKYEANKSIRIVPILLVPYNFKRKGKYNLARFSSLPYMLKPISAFANHNVAWHTISELIRIMIERDLDPGKEGISLPPELDRYLERIANGLEDIRS